MKKFLVAMVLLAAATFGCNSLVRTADINGVHTQNLTPKENQEAFIQGQNNMDACRAMIKANPKANVRCGEVIYQGSPPLALVPQRGVLVNRENIVMHVTIYGSSLPNQGNQERVEIQLDCPPGKSPVTIYAGKYFIRVSYNGRSYTDDLPIDTILANHQVDGADYDWFYQVLPPR